MVMALEEERPSFKKTKSLNLKKMFQAPGKSEEGEGEGGGGGGGRILEVTRGSADEEIDDPEKNTNIVDEEHCSVKSPVSDGPGSTPTTPNHHKQPSDTEQIKDRFCKLLLGEDMSGGGKGVSSALALSNTITNLAASCFGEQTKLQPMSPERKDKWRKEIGWFLSVADHIVELVPSTQQLKDGKEVEIMVTKQRSDLLMNIPALRKLDTMLIGVFDNFRETNEFWYESKTDGNDDKWWHPTCKVPENGLSESSRRWLQFQKDIVNQVLKAALAINAQVLSEMAVPESYIESLPKHGRATLGDSIYKSITMEMFDPEQFLAALDLTTEHRVEDLKNKIEASSVIWKRKMNNKESRSSWSMSVDKRELFEERAETILLILKQRFPGIAQSTLDVSKIEQNKDIGHAILESYSRVLESLAYKVMSSIDGVLHADLQNQLQRQSVSSVQEPKTITINGNEEIDPTEYTPRTLSQIMGWSSGEGVKGKDNQRNEMECYFKGENDRSVHKSSPCPTPKRKSYLEKLESLASVGRSPSERH